MMYNFAGKLYIITRIRYGEPPLTPSVIKNIKNNPGKPGLFLLKHALIAAVVVELAAWAFFAWTCFVHRNGATTDF
jgi:hypothetical protein